MNYEIILGTIKSIKICAFFKKAVFKYCFFQSSLLIKNRIPFKVLKNKLLPFTLIFKNGNNFV